MPTPSEIHFDEIALNYDSYKKEYNFYYKILKNAITSRIVNKSPRVLDVGCGTGAILEYVKPDKGLGIDISEKMIKIARRKYRKNKRFSFRVHNIEAGPISGNFEYILFNDVIEHVSNQKAAIANLAKSMQKNTELIFSMANPAWAPILWLLEKLHLKMPEGPHKWINEIKLRALLDQHKLKIKSKAVYFPRLPKPFQNLGLIYFYVIRKA